MKIKLISLFALMLCVSAFLIPFYLHASSNVAPPSVDASITDNILRIEVIVGFYGVEAVFINDIRFNYRVDSVIILDARDYVGNGKTVSIYAIDFSGNKSNVVILENPFYVEPQQQLNPFTPDGQASVLDRANENEGKDFYTFTTPAGNIFHLIIDHHRRMDNVYFLNAVTEKDLITMAEKSGNPIQTPEPPPIVVTPVEPEPPTEPEPPPPELNKTNSNSIIFIIIGVLAVGGFAYYSKIVKPKQQSSISDDEFNDEDDDEDIEFEDETNTDDEKEEIKE